MDAAELRIGNYVSLKVIKTLIIKDYEYFNDAHLYKPIPITDEWLLKFGFEKKVRSDHSLMYSKEGRFTEKMSIVYWNYVATGNDGWLYSLMDEEGKYSEFGVPLENIHQLQNLYYALTGKELTIKD